MRDTWYFDVPFYHARRRGDLGHPFLHSPIFDESKASFAFVAEKPLVSLAAAGAGVNSWSQKKVCCRTLCSQGEVLVLNLASLQMGLWAARPSTGIHCMKQLQVCEWPERLLGYPTIICCTEGRGPICCVYLLVLFCTFAFQTMLSLFVSPSWSHRIQMQSSDLRSKYTLDYY